MSDNSKHSLGMILCTLQSLKMAEETVSDLLERRTTLKKIQDELWKQRRETEKELIRKSAERYLAVVDPNFGDCEVIPVSHLGPSSYHEFDIKLIEGKVVIEVDAELVASAAPPMIMQFGKPVTLSNFDEACVFKTEADAKAWVAGHPAVIDAEREKNE